MQQLLPYTGNVKAPYGFSGVALTAQVSKLSALLVLLQVVIGGASNTKSFIRNATQGTSWVDVDTPGILSCDEMRTFWIHWDAGLIRVGRGPSVGRGEFMYWFNAFIFPVHALSVSTGWTAIGLWEFSDIAGTLSRRVSLYGN